MAKRKQPPKRRTKGRTSGEPDTSVLHPEQRPDAGDDDAEMARTFHIGLETAGEAWIEAFRLGLSDPVIAMMRIEEDGREKVDVRYGERRTMIECLSETHPEAAARLRAGPKPGRPMTVVVDHHGVIRIVNLADPR
jgi:hypothetical protein